MENNIFAVILAAGKSSRMKGTDKILEKLINNKEVIINTIYKFDAIESISKIILVTRDDIIDKIKDIIKKYNFKKNIYVIEGGKTRTESLFLGYEFIKNKFGFNKNDFCLIHDGARPLIRQSDILTCLDLAFKNKAAAVGVKINDTIKKADENSIITQTVDRSNLFYIQTPQIFENSILDLAIKNAKEKNLDFTDDCQLIESIGQKVYISSGDFSNIKITTQEDLFLVNKLI
ncbi:MAG: 2-C-methyl-D-erythritol 4-phosphate cytidylyltransferase [Oscillospiraceae bacterium]|nr:2-C-methyl-D-erythritol 4-phosphate cytidylyltransferase [Oscillospiraceae bacterium]